MRLKDKVAVVTGGGSGMGKAVAIEFARQGATVVVADIQLDAAGCRIQVVLVFFRWENIFLVLDRKSVV
mgnify:CR=1 FL=1